MKVERADIEAKVRQIEQALTDTRESVRQKAVVGVIAVAVLIALAFVLGRQGGRKSAAIVEVYNA